MAADSVFTAGGDPAAVPARGVDVDRVRLGGGDRGLAPVDRAARSARTSGWCPTEHSSGGSRSQGWITKTGNTHARRLLVEAAWHHRTPTGPVGRCGHRWEQAPAAARARGHAANQRLHTRWTAFEDRKKRPVIANVAIARELAGWCWSLAVMTDLTPHDRPDEHSRCRQASGSDPRQFYEQSCCATTDHARPLDSGQLRVESPVLR